jgi:hypothetical protein
MSEVKAGFARDWIEFSDPNNEDEIYKCDLTWLTSNWSCIYGDAMFSDEADELRTLKAAEYLTPDMWQFYEQARPKKPGGKLRIADSDEDDERKTRTVDDACIFLNRKGHEAPGFTGDFGCVLHHLALKRDLHFVDTKPDVCWQLPLRRAYETREVGEREYSIIVIGEYERLAWGDGGEDFDWYCTSNPEAHVGKEPVYISNKAELTKMMGEPAYAILAQHCDRRIAGIREAQAKFLPLYVIQHPATVIASK